MDGWTQLPEAFCPALSFRHRASAFVFYVFERQFDGGASDRNLRAYCLLAISFTIFLYSCDNCVRDSNLLFALDGEM